MASFGQEYKQLNAAQKKAVDNIDGPILVVAGPGTGKTQLLSMRVANIIKQTDISPSNILCLTFTDNAARNMRERLESIIGQAAYHVSIHTFHSFGADIISQYPDFFNDRELIQQVDELGSYELLKDIFEELPHSNPLSVKIGDEYIMLRDALSIIGWFKQNALSPDELKKILKDNQKFMESLSAKLAETFKPIVSPKQISKYKELQKAISRYDGHDLSFGFPPYNFEPGRELAEAIEATDLKSRYAPKITVWRNKWCEKNAKGEHVFKDSARNYRKMQALASVYEHLRENMSRQGLYDFDDMIVEAVHALETNYELRANLQERYQYILVDEFQDTNKAQLRILIALGDNPLFENRPNIMTVGDDDQAIYAFQGAEVSNMVAFAKMYDQPQIINLSQNYRSTKKILETSFDIAGQISNRLSGALNGQHKQLSVMTPAKSGIVGQVVLPSELAQYNWIADQVVNYLKKGTPPEQIVILAPRHRYLERLVPYLAKQNIPIAYERRENILEAPLIVQLLTMAKLVVAIADNQHDETDALLAEVISYEFWDISAEELLQVSIDCFNKNQHWLTALIKHKNSTLKDIATWFVDLSRQSKTEPLEYILDSLLGVVTDGEDSEADEPPSPSKKPKFVSPMRKYYFSDERYEKSTDTYLTLLGQLSTLRQRLRNWKPNRTLYVHDFIIFAQLHKEANLKIIDTNPHTQTTRAVQVMTTYKAKGLEFDTVFVINAQDEVWGPTVKSRSMRIALPKNLPVAPAGDNDNDKLRLLFVALTRAKHNLIITGYSHDLENRLSLGLSYIGGNSGDSNSVPSNLSPKFIDKPVSAEAVEILTTDWAYRFRNIIADKPTLFEPILENYKLSVTHLNNFIDIVGAGPEFFFTHNLLRFPQALTPPIAYGDAMHHTLQWIHTQYRQTSKLPTTKKVQDYFSDILSRRHLRTAVFNRLETRGRKSIARYLKIKGASWNPEDLIERGFNNEGVVVGKARLSGKIDKMHFTGPGSVQVIDFKTGKPASSWQGKDENEKIKLHKYKQQLLFYKLLVENSASFGHKVKVNQVGIEFVEADEQNELADILSYNITEQELNQFTQLINKIWQHVVSLDMPDVSKYPKTLKGIQTFEKDLIEGKI